VASLLARGTEDRAVERVLGRRRPLRVWRRDLGVGTGWLCRPGISGLSGGHGRSLQGGMGIEEASRSDRDWLAEFPIDVG
jgi:hypothetical protein